MQLWDREAARFRAASAQLLKDSAVLEVRVRSWLLSTVAEASSANVLELLSGSSEESIRSRVYAQRIEGIRTIAKILQDEFELADDTAIAAAGMIGSSIVGFIPAWRVAGLSDHDATELFVRMCVGAARAVSTA